jgi:hypothetical protein
MPSAATPRLERVAGRNGKQSPPRPKIEIQAANASPEEAAAIAAALEQFLVETAPPAQRTLPGSAWQTAALAEGVSAHQLQPGGWGPSSR